MGKKNKYGVQLAVGGGKPPAPAVTRPTPPKPQPKPTPQPTYQSQPQQAPRVSFQVSPPVRQAPPEQEPRRPANNNTVQKPSRPDHNRIKSYDEAQSELTTTRSKLDRMRSVDHSKVDAREGFRLFREMMALKNQLNDPNAQFGQGGGGGEDNSEPPINITIRVMTGTEFPFSCRLDESVMQVKQRLEDTLNVPVAQQILVCNGKTVSGSGSVRNCNLKEGSIVFLINDEPQ